MPKKLNITIILVVLLLALTVYTVVRANAKFKEFKNQLTALEISNIDISKVKDGVYEGVSDLQIVTAKVKVTVEQGKITKIDILEHKHGPSKKYGADGIVNTIIEKQSLDVDAISGASGSSKVMRKAVEDALKKGL